MSKETKIPEVVLTASGFHVPGEFKKIMDEKYPDNKGILRIPELEDLYAQYKEDPDIIDSMKFIEPFNKAISILPTSIVSFIAKHNNSNSYLRHKFVNDCIMFIRSRYGGQHGYGVRDTLIQSWESLLIGAVDDAKVSVNNPGNVRVYKSESTMGDWLKVTPAKDALPDFVISMYIIFGMKIT